VNMFVLCAIDCSLIVYWVSEVVGMLVWIVLRLLLSGSVLVI